MSLLKKQVHAALLQLLCGKITRLENNLKDLRTSAANETKSTAGDKYETALALLQTEQDNVKKQLQAQMEQRAVIEQIDPAVLHSTITNGSLVSANEEYFFISTGAGKINVDGKIVFTLSSHSPLGKLLCGLKAGETTFLNNKMYTINSVN